MFPPERLAGYVASVCADIGNAAVLAERLGGEVEEVDSIYFGGGTPSLLSPDLVRELFVTVREAFIICDAPEITVECAPNSVSDETLDALLQAGVNRISFGAQSFVDRETSSVARLHKAEDTVRDVGRIRAAGIENVSVDLIAGLPHQTLESWDYSLSQALDLGLPHVSVYMLEVDEDSRLGREVMAGGVRYHAHSVPDEENVVRMYEHAIERLGQAGVPQYEISNFARPGCESRHNLKYWVRDSYFGFGADAHSMLHSPAPGVRDIRFATQEELTDFESATDHYNGKVQTLNNREALEESLIVGLRLNRGVDLRQLASEYGEDPATIFSEEIRELANAELVEHNEHALRLTPRGRLLSNEVFERFLTTTARI